MFSDESMLYLRRVNGRKRIGRRRRELHVPATVIPVVVSQGGEAMVRAWASVTAKTNLVNIEGNLNGQRYIKKVLTLHVFSFLRFCDGCQL